jgi:hypothetical protein
MKRRRLNPRKLLVASAGVATINYALAAGCSSKRGSEVVVANLVAAPPGFSVDDGSLGNGGSFPGTVANLVAPPPSVLPSPVPSPVSPSPASFEPHDAGQDAAPGDAAAGTDAG